MPRVGVGAGLGLRKRKPVIGLDIDFRTGSLPAGWSFSRTGAGTALDASGQLVAFASGQPRVTSRGLLIEEARTNRISDTGTSLANVLVNGSASIEVVTDTAALTAAGLLNLNGSNVYRIVSTGAWRIQFSGVADATQVHTGSIWIRSLSGTSQCGWVWSGDNVQTGYVCTTAYTRMAQTLTTSTGSRSPTIRGDGSGTFYMVMPQLEQAWSASAFIPTSGAAATRAADTASVLHTVNVGSDDLTIFADADSGGTGNCTALASADGNRLQLRYEASTQRWQLVYIAVNGSTSTATTGSGGNKIALRITGNSATMFINGVSGTTVNLQTTTISSWVIGRRASSEFLNSYVRRIAILRGLTADQARLMTA